ncbi:uncharacterized protein LOC122932059 [Bufo gargarizans]|uniref:uncharacterized protein LOC122932059 n=1 Tax=Bufo gargarizans TaxID=30331 RepID=UPI001CF53EF1|nr:uncharacterized protein LOC122932059 [Bufo gargarizans]XP_044142179.1 uncharacterized protein LOC122932059 [Bufo gargarizans]XP_044142180.1 uncharacterized protein LOC122932059 [Bufo gargarizans]
MASNSSTPFLEKELSPASEVDRLWSSQVSDSDGTSQAGAEDVDRGQVKAAPDQEHETSHSSGHGARQRGQGRGGRARWGRQTDSSPEEDEEHAVMPPIDVALLIQLVEARPPLWDQSEGHHTDHLATRRLWEEVYRGLMPTWETLSRRAQSRCGRAIIMRWRSMRERFIRDFNAQRLTPSGSGASSTCPHPHERALQFLRYSDELRRTPSSTEEDQQWEAPSESEIEEIAGPSVSQEPAWDSEGPLPAQSPPTETTRAYILSSFAGVGRRRAGRRHTSETEEQASIIRDCLLSFEEKITRTREELLAHIGRLEGAVQPENLSPNGQFLQALAPLVDRVSPELVPACRAAMIQTIRDFMSCPPSPTYPPTHSHPHGRAQDLSVPQTPSALLPAPTSFSPPLVTPGPAVSSSLDTPFPPAGYSRDPDSLSALLQPDDQDRGSCKV